MNWISHLTKIDKANRYIHLSQKNIKFPTEFKDLLYTSTVSNKLKGVSRNGCKHVFITLVRKL